MLEGLRKRLASFSTKTHIGGISIAAFSVAVLVWQLGSWTTGLGPNEVASAHNSVSISAIADNPLYAPQKVIQYLFQSLGWQTAFWLRLATAAIAALLTVGFYLLVRNWFGKQSAFFGTLLYISTGWLLVSGRQASAEVLLLAPSLVLAAYLWQRHAKRRNLAWLCLILLIGLSLYVPGMLWLVVLGLVLIRGNLRQQTKGLGRWWLAGSAILFLVVLTPLVIAVIRDWTIIRPLLLIPGHFLSVVDSFKQILWAFGGMVYRVPHHFFMTVSRWPMLNAVQIALCFFGAYAVYRKAPKLFYGSLTVILFAGITSGLNQNSSLLLIALPAFGILMTAGLRYLLIEWQTVFPRNPLPRATALILISALVAMQLWFGLRYTYRAWPNTVATKMSYVLKYP